MEHLLLFVAAAAMAASLQGCTGKSPLASVEDGTGTYKFQDTAPSWKCKNPDGACTEGTFQMDGSWGSDQLQIPAQPITASGCWHMPDNGDIRQLKFAGSSNGFGTDSTFSYDPVDKSYQLCFASEQDQFHGTMISNSEMSATGAGSMTSTFTSCKGYKACDAAQQCSSRRLSDAPSADDDAPSADDDCEQHKITYSWQIEPDPSSPLQYSISHYECTFDDTIDCSNFLSDLQSSGDSSKEQATKAGISFLTTSLAFKQGGADIVKNGI